MPVTKFEKVSAPRPLRSDSRLATESEGGMSDSEIGVFQAEIGTEMVMFLQLELCSLTRGVAPQRERRERRTARMARNWGLIVIVLTVVVRGGCFWTMAGWFEGKVLWG